MKYLTLVLSLFFGLPMIAQQSINCPCQNELNDAFGPNLKGQVYRGMPGMLGTEFFNTFYVEGDIFSEQGEVIKDQQIRYNGRIDGVLLQPPQSSKEILLDKFFIKGFCMKNTEGSSNLCFYKIKTANELGGDSAIIFGQLLYHNKLSLYVYRRYVYIQEIIEAVDDKHVAKKEYGPSFVYYFQLPGGRSVGFKSFKKRDLYKLFPGNKDLMKKLFKEKHQRRFRNEDDLIKITAILNSLYI